MRPLPHTPLAASDPVYPVWMGTGTAPEAQLVPQPSASDRRLARSPPPPPPPLPPSTSSSSASASASSSSFTPLTFRRAIAHAHGHEYNMPCSPASTPFNDDRCAGTPLPPPPPSSWQSPELPPHPGSTPRSTQRGTVPPAPPRGPKRSTSLTRRLRAMTVGEPTPPPRAPSTRYGRSTELNRTEDPHDALSPSYSLGNTLNADPIAIPPPHFNQKNTTDHWGRASPGPSSNGLGTPQVDSVPFDHTHNRPLTTTHPSRTTLTSPRTGNSASRLRDRLVSVASNLSLGNLVSSSTHDDMVPPSTSTTLDTEVCEPGEPPMGNTILSTSAPTNLSAASPWRITNNNHATLSPSFSLSNHLGFVGEDPTEQEGGSSSHVATGASLPPVSHEPDEGPRRRFWHFRAPMHQAKEPTKHQSARPSSARAHRPMPDRPQTPTSPVFGVPLATSLARASIPLECFPRGTHAPQSNDDWTEGQYVVPAIVYRCIEYLTTRHAEYEEGLYRQPGSSTLIKSLQSCFDTYGDVPLLGDPSHEVAKWIEDDTQDDPTAIKRSFLRSHHRTVPSPSPRTPALGPGMARAQKEPLSPAWLLTHVHTPVQEAKVDTSDTLGYYWDVHAVADLLKSYVRSLPESQGVLPPHTIEALQHSLPVLSTVEPTTESLSTLSTSPPALLSSSLGLTVAPTSTACPPAPPLVPHHQNDPDSGQAQQAQQAQHVGNILRSTLPPPNYALLRLLTAHLSRVASRSSINKMTESNLGIIWASAFSQLPRSILRLLITHFDTVFAERTEPCLSSPLGSAPPLPQPEQQGTSPPMFSSLGFAIPPTPIAVKGASEVMGSGSPPPPPPGGPMTSRSPPSSLQPAWMRSHAASPPSWPPTWPPVPPSNPSTSPPNLPTSTFASQGAQSSAQQPTGRKRAPPPLSVRTTSMAPSPVPASSPGNPWHSSHSSHLSPSTLLSARSGLASVTSGTSGMAGSAGSSSGSCATAGSAPGSAPGSMKGSSPPTAATALFVEPTTLYSASPSSTSYSSRHSPAVHTVYPFASPASPSYPGSSRPIYPPSTHVGADPPSVPPCPPPVARTTGPTFVHPNQLYARQRSQSQSQAYQQAQHAVRPTHRPVLSSGSQGFRLPPTAPPCAPPCAPPTVPSIVPPPASPISSSQEQPRSGNGSVARPEPVRAPKPGESVAFHRPMTSATTSPSLPQGSQASPTTSPGVRYTATHEAYDAVPRHAPSFLTNLPTLNQSLVTPHALRGGPRRARGRSGTSATSGMATTPSIPLANTPTMHPTDAPPPLPDTPDA